MLTARPAFNSNPHQYEKNPLLYFAVASLDQPAVIEIGAQHGWGLLPLAAAAKAKGGWCVGVDVKLRPELRQLLTEHDLLNFVELHECNSAAFWQSLADNCKADVIVIDGWHEYPTSHMDIAYALRHLSDRGYLFVHDVLSFPGPARAFAELCCEANGIFSLVLKLGEDGMGVAFIVDRKRLCV